MRSSVPSRMARRNTSLIVSRSGAPGGRILDAAEADIRVAARDGLIDRVERHELEARRPPDTARDEICDLDVEADERVWMRRVGLDKWSAALGIAGPPKLARLS